MKKLLQLLEEDCAMSTAQLAALADMTEDDAAAAIKKLKDDGVLLGNKAIINWDNSDYEYVTALIEVNVTPQKSDGFDRIAERIYQYDEVESVYLMSGGFDFTVIISGRSLKEVALFVARKLSTIEGVTGTATHFILKKYKEKHLIFETQDQQQERFTFD